MQTYGNFFNPPKPENQIVDKWRIAVRKLLLYQIYQQIFSARSGMRIQFRGGCLLNNLRKCHLAGVFVSLPDFYSVK